jgi:uncharacterized membrane protein (DUF2068 family)
MTIKRPFGVSLIAGFMLVLGLARTSLGIFLLARNPYAEAGIESTLPAGTASPNFTLTLGIVFLVIGLLGLLMSYGMFTLKGWAWMWTVVVVSLNMVGVFASYHSGQTRGIETLISFTIFVLVLYYLSTTPVKRAFNMLPHR